MNLFRFDMDQLSGYKMVDGSVNDNVNLSLKDEEIFFHPIVVMGLEIFPGLKLHYGEIHAGAFHQVFRSAASEPVFTFVLMNDPHIIVSSLPN
jgi:hypothetical protein